MVKTIGSKHKNHIEYICPECLKNFGCRKADYVRHSNKLKPCKKNNIIKTENIDNEKKKNNICNEQIVGVKKINDYNIKLRGMSRNKRCDKSVGDSVHAHAETMDFFLGYDKELKWITEIY